MQINQRLTNRVHQYGIHYDDIVHDKPLQALTIQ